MLQTPRTGLVAYLECTGYFGNLECIICVDTYIDHLRRVAFHYIEGDNTNQKILDDELLTLI